MSNNIKIPEMLDSVIEDAMSKGEQYKKREKHERSKRRIIAAASLCALITLGFTRKVAIYRKCIQRNKIFYCR